MAYGGGAGYNHMLALAAAPKPTRTDGLADDSTGGPSSLSRSDISHRISMQMMKPMLAPSCPVRPTLIWTAVTTISSWENFSPIPKPLVVTTATMFLLQIGIFSATKVPLKHTKRFPGQSGLRQMFCSNDPFAVGRGDVRVEDRYGDEETTILVCDVLHVPRARSNLISGVQLDKAGVIATFGGGHVTLSL